MKWLPGNKALGEFQSGRYSLVLHAVAANEVTFDIDANVFCMSSAKDKATGKENKITIKAEFRFVRKTEIQRMIKDAEVNAAEDHKVRELTEARNQGDALVHTTKKSLEEYGDKLDAPAKESIEGAIKDLEESLKGDDKADIDSKMSALSAAAQKLGEKMYADQAPEGAAAGAAGAGASWPGAAPEH